MEMIMCVAFLLAGRKTGGYIAGFSGKK